MMLQVSTTTSTTTTMTRQSHAGKLLLQLVRLKLGMTRIVVLHFVRNGGFFHGHELVQFIQSFHINQLAPKFGTENKTDAYFDKLIPVMIFTLNEKVC